jgi:probable F420-dependent oxidoreductase
MKVGIVPINVGLASPSAVTAIAQAAESAGLESVWTFEHVMVPVDYASKYPYHPSGKMPVLPNTPFLDPLVTLAFVAAKTTTLRLGTGINILPQANPLLMAKQVASLDVLSGGRLELGLGTGWLSEEFQAMGTPFRRRGARFDDYLTAMKQVWSGETVDHQGEFLQWAGFQSHPTPKQTPHPPIWVGGTSDRAYRRVAQTADGWIAPNHKLDSLKSQLARLHEIARQCDRAPETIRVTATWVLSKEPDLLKAYEDLGVERVLVPLAAAGVRDPLQAVERIAEAAARG